MSSRGRHRSEVNPERLSKVLCAASIVILDNLHAIIYVPRVAFNAYGAQALHRLRHTSATWGRIMSSIMFALLAFVLNLQAKELDQCIGRLGDQAREVASALRSRQQREIADITSRCVSIEPIIITG